MTRSDFNVGLEKIGTIQSSSQEQPSSQQSSSTSQSIAKQSSLPSSSISSSKNPVASFSSSISSSTPPVLVLGLRGYGCKYSYNNPSDPLPVGQTLQCFLIDKTTNTDLIQIRDCTGLGSCFFNTAIYLGYKVGNVQQIIEYSNPDYTGAGYTYASIKPKPITSLAGGGAQRYQYLKMFFYITDTKALTFESRLTLKISAYSLTFCDPKVGTNYTLACYPECTITTTCLAETKLNNDTYFQNYNEYVPNGLNLDFNSLDY